MKTGVAVIAIVAAFGVGYWLGMKKGKSSSSTSTDTTKTK